MSAPPFSILVREFSRADLVRIWERTFDVGGVHHTRRIRDEGAVAEIAARVREASPNEPPSWVVARAIHDIVTWHPFWDCNHRTAAALAAVFLRSAGYESVRDRQGWLEFLRSIDRDGRSVSDVQRAIDRFFT